MAFDPLNITNHFVIRSSILDALLVVFPNDGCGPAGGRNDECRVLGEIGINQEWKHGIAMYLGFPNEGHPAIDIEFLKYFAGLLHYFFDECSHRELTRKTIQFF